MNTKTSFIVLSGLLIAFAFTGIMVATDSAFAYQRHSSSNTQTNSQTGQNINVQQSHAGFSGTITQTGSPSSGS